MRRLWSVCLLAISIIAVTAQSFAVPAGINWESSGATFHTQMFGTFPANQQATAAQFNSAFQQAAVQWNNKSNFTYVTVNNAVDPCDTNHSLGVSTQGWGFDTTASCIGFGSSTLAITRKTISGWIGKIVDADIVFNSAIVFDVHAGNRNPPGSFVWCGTQGQPYDFTRVAVHELGHALGLQHTPHLSRSIMDPSYSECFEAPETLDVNNLQALYGLSVSTILLDLNSTFFNTGNTLTLTETTAASNPVTLADKYIALQLPDGTLLVMQPDGSFSPAITPLVSNLQVADSNAQVFSYTFTGAEPVGTYKWFSALMQPGTLTPIGTINQISFDFAP